jgi:acetyl-CoA carboxylase biotin carboxyl carrier protein
MIDLEFLERLIQALDESGLDSLEIERGGTRVRLSRTPPAPPVVLEGGAGAAPASGPAPARATAAGPPAAEAAAPVSNLLEITSPMVGTFYHAPAPDAPPYVDEGQRVGKGDVVCIIEAMKLMNELESEVEGRIVEICVENAQPVEYGQVLFRVDPS